MHIASALRRKRDEIAATIAAYEARIDAARMDLAALDQAARLFDPEAGRDETVLIRELAALGKREQNSRPAQWEERASRSRLVQIALAFESVSSRRRSHMPQAQDRRTDTGRIFLFELAVTH